SEIEAEEAENKDDSLNKTTLESCDLNLKELINPREKIKAQYEGRRWSARTQQRLLDSKDKEDTGAMMKTDGNKKRNLEGLHKEAVQGKILEGVQVLLSCAHKVM
ncbi:unnamed protein product, partial [Urochloa humidicola]